MNELIARYVKIPAQQRLLGFVGIVVALCAGYYFLVYSGQAEEIERLERQHQKLAGEQADRETYIQNIARAEARLVELQESLNIARSQLPDDPDVPELLAQLGNKARQAGLAIDRFEPKGETIQDFYAEIAFDMRVRGSYHEIAMFVDSLAKLDRIMNVTGLSMAQPKTQNQRVIVDGGFTIKTYRFVDAAEAAEEQAKSKSKSKTKGKKK